MSKRNRLYNEMLDCTIITRTLSIKIGTCGKCCCLPMLWAIWCAYHRHPSRGHSTLPSNVLRTIKVSSVGLFRILFWCQYRLRLVWCPMCICEFLMDCPIVLQLSAFQSLSVLTTLLDHYGSLEEVLLSGHYGLRNMTWWGLKKEKVLAQRYLRPGPFVYLDNV